MINLMIFHRFSFQVELENNMDITHGVQDFMESIRGCKFLLDDRVTPTKTQRSNFPDFSQNK